MNISIVGRHIEVTPAIKAFTEDKLAKIERFFNPILDVHVVLSVSRFHQTAEVILKSNTETFTASADTEDMYASIDQAVEKVIKHLKKVKGKLKDHKAKEPKIDQVFAAEDPLDDDEPEAKIFIKPIEIKPMDIDEAILQLGVLKKDFLLFKRTDTSEINLLKVTKSGDYEVYEPEH